MKKTNVAIALGAFAFATIAPAAGPVNARQINQERRIDAGKRSGKLTRAESAQLKAEQRAIAREEDRMRARNHGKLSARDKQILRARQEAANRHILNQKHDAQRGPNKLKL
jgi:hypothetical protein